eukprot:959279-Prorocentrum_minimum.AAC.2
MDVFTGLMLRQCLDRLADKTSEQSGEVTVSGPIDSVYSNVSSNPLIMRMFRVVHSCPLLVPTRARCRRRCHVTGVTYGRAQQCQLTPAVQQSPAASEMSDCRARDQDSRRLGSRREAWMDSRRLGSRREAWRDSRRYSRRDSGSGSGSCGRDGRTSSRFRSSVSLRSSLLRWCSRRRNLTKVLKCADQASVGVSVMHFFYAHGDTYACLILTNVNAGCSDNPLGDEASSYWVEAAGRSAGGPPVSLALRLVPRSYARL